MLQTIYNVVIAFASGWLIEAINCIDNTCGGNSLLRKLTCYNHALAQFDCLVESYYSCPCFVPCSIAKGLCYCRRYSLTTNVLTFDPRKARKKYISWYENIYWNKDGMKCKYWWIWSVSEEMYSHINVACCRVYYNTVMKALFEIQYGGYQCQLLCLSWKNCHGECMVTLKGEYKFT